jgi:hypothetical protein
VITARAGLAEEYAYVTSTDGPSYMTVQNGSG